jgi:hypothetical protein
MTEITPQLRIKSGEPRPVPVEAVFVTPFFTFTDPNHVGDSVVPYERCSKSHNLLRLVNDRQQCFPRSIVSSHISSHPAGNGHPSQACHPRKAAVEVDGVGVVRVGAVRS